MTLEPGGVCEVFARIAGRKKLMTFHIKNILV